MTDQEILDGVSRDEDGALEEIYRNHLKGIIPMVLKNSGSIEDAEDIQQKTVMVLYEKIKKTDFILYEQTKLSTFLFSVAQNLWRRELKIRKKINSFEGKELEDLIDPEGDNISIYENTENQKIATMVLEKLNNTCKELLHYFYFEKMKLSEIATTLGIASVQTAKSKRYKCFQQYKKLVLKELSKNEVYGY